MIIYICIILFIYNIYLICISYIYNFIQKYICSFIHECIHLSDMWHLLVVRNNATMDMMMYIHLSSCFQFCGVYALEWNCWVLGEFYAKIFWGATKQPSRAAILFYFPISPEISPPPWQNLYFFLKMINYRFDLHIPGVIFVHMTFRRTSRTRLCTLWYLSSGMIFGALHRSTWHLPKPPKGCMRTYLNKDLLPKGHQCHHSGEGWGVACTWQWGE